MLFLLQQMYIDLGLVETFHIDVSVVSTWLIHVYRPIRNFTKNLADTYVNKIQMPWTMLLCIVWLIVNLWFLDRSLSVIVRKQDIAMALTQVSVWKRGLWGKTTKVQITLLL